MFIRYVLNLHRLNIYQNQSVIVIFNQVTKNIKNFEHPQNIP